MMIRASLRRRKSSEAGVGRRGRGVSSPGRRGRIWRGPMTLMSAATGLFMKAPFAVHMSDRGDGVGPGVVVAAPPVDVRWRRVGPAARLEQEPPQPVVQVVERGRQLVVLLLLAGAEGQSDPAGGGQERPGQGALIDPAGGRGAGWVLPSVDRKRIVPAPQPRKRRAMASIKSKSAMVSIESKSMDTHEEGTPWPT